MSETAFNILRLIEEIILIVISAYVLPWVRERVAASKLDGLVHAAQAMYASKTGAERREIVIGWYKSSGISKILRLNDDQIRALLEEAYQKMVIAKGA